MNKKGHLSTGAASGSVVGVFVASGPLAALVCTGIGGVAALAPDIDHHRATITRALGPVGTALSWIIRKVSLGVYTLTATSKDTPGAGGSHRGLTHTGVAALATGAALWALLGYLGVDQALPYALAAAVGIVVHIGGDAITATGVPLIWPVKYRGERWYPCRIPLITITGGGLAEKLITGAAWTVAVALLATSGLGLVDLDGLRPAVF
ncbi:hypothetical protein GCM10027174_44990 [Salinifilum aidingensis]